TAFSRKAIRCPRCARLRRNIGSIRLRSSRVINNWWTKVSSKPGEVAECSSITARARFCCKGNARSFLLKTGPEFMRRFSGSASRRKNSSMATVRPELPSQILRSRKQQTQIPPERRAEAMACIEARALRKTYGATVALDGVNLRVEEGRIVGLIGPNGAGKTTALNAILGLTPYQGELRVLGRDPWAERNQLMRDVCFIADVAVLPRWIRVSDALDYVAGVHPRFDRAKAETFLARTTIRLTNKVKELSKGMVTQLHLALVMAIDASLLVLDEPTLGLDLLFRKQFYDSLLSDYFDRNRTIVVTTHKVEEIEHVLTDLVFIDRGRIVLNATMEEIETRYVELVVRPERIAAARALKPINERQVLGGNILLFDHVERQQLAALGEVRTPSIADLFVAIVGNHASQAQGAAL